MSDITNPLQSISYTNKDFTSIYTELLDLTKELAATWDPTISNESDPGVILLKLNAIIGDKLSYNSDTNVLELFPLSVTQEKNARQLFEQLGYYMHWYKAATTDVSVVWEGTKNSTLEYTIPAFTMVSDYNNTLTYTLIGPTDGTTLNTFKVGDQKLKLDGSSISFKAIQGIPVIYSINGESTITINNLDRDNRLYFPTLDVAENGIFITNINANNYTDWKRVDNLLVQSLSSESLFYKFGVTQDTSTCYLEFPENAEEIIKNGINITYIKTLGEEGNISYKTIEKFYNEFSPIEDDTIVFSTNNVRILNYASAINGENPQSINSAYKGYKSTIGVFETLITLRDYINYILRSGLVSNGFVCDRTNDIQCTYNIMTQANEIDQLVNVVEEENNSPLLHAFDLKLYLLQLPNYELVTKAIYDSTFNIMDESHLLNIKNYIDDIKCVSHDYAKILPVTTTRSHFCYFKNKYPISGRITTQYQLTNASANEVMKNIREALYNNLNAKEVTFGEEISPEFIYDTIIKSDSRIKNVMLDNIEYLTYAVCYSEELKTFFEVEISTEDSNPINVTVSKSANFTLSVDEETFTNKIGVGNYSVYQFIYDNANSTWRLNNVSVDIEDYGITIDGTPAQNDTIIVGISLKTQLKDEVLTKSILAGTTQFFIQDEIFDYRLDQKYYKNDSELLNRVKKVSTELIVPITRSSDEYVLRENESIQLYSPNLIDSTSYSTYVKFEYRLKNHLSADEDYQLTSNEYFIMYWKESQTENYYKYAVYGPGNIIKLKAFDLDVYDGRYNAGADLVSYMENIGTEDNPIYYTDSAMNNRMTYSISQDIYNMSSAVNSLSSSKVITIRKINQIVLESSNSYCYWILNEKLSDSNGQEKYRLFEEGEFSRILSSGEYFIYTDESLTNLAILGSGTLITRSEADFVWEVSVKNASSILENGISAFTESDWFKIKPSNATLTLTEQYYVSINPGATLKLSLIRNRKDYCITKITSTPTSLSPSLDRDVWFSNSSGYGNFVFTYNGTNWTLNNTAVSLVDYGISITGTPTSGNKITVNVKDWNLRITKDGVYKYFDTITGNYYGVNINTVEDSQWISTTLKDFSVSYKDVYSINYIPVASLNLESSDYSWNARSLLGVDTSNTKEQTLLQNQKVIFTLQNKWWYKNSPIDADANDEFYFTIDDIDYGFTVASSMTITSIIFDLEKEELLVNGDNTPYIENASSGTLIELTDKFDMNGSDFGDDETDYYMQVFLTNFNLKVDGSQTISTYQLNDQLEIEYLSVYSYAKYIPSDTRIHINDDGQIDLEIVANSGNYSISWDINLPQGEYILPLVVGTEELEESGYLHVYLNNVQLHAMNDEDLTNFNLKQTYYLYMNITSSQQMTLTFSVNSSIGKNIPFILGNIYKYYFRKEFSRFKAEKIVKLLSIWDKDNMYNYIYKVNSDDEISNPLAGKSFLLNNHIYNKYTIPQMLDINLNIIGKQ